MQSSPLELENSLIRAGAGAGKTTTLTKHVLEVADRYFSENGRWPQIVVTTFTRKATQELRERLILKACEENREDLLQFVASPSKLFISTLHGVFNLFLRRYGHLFDYDAGFTLLSETQAQKLAKMCLRKILYDNLDESHLELLEEYSFNSLYRAVWDYSHFQKECDGAEFYSERDFAAAAKDILAQGVKNLEKIAVVITENVEHEKWRQFANEIEAGLSGWSEESSVSDLRQLIESLGRRPPKNKSVPEDVAEEVKALWASAKGVAEQPGLESECWKQYLAAFSAFDHLARLFSERFAQEKRKRGQLEISDLELLTLEFVRHQPEICQLFADEWDYWLVDEYQDTSPIQVDILERIVGEKKSFVVGDPQQSIYLFRGARSELFAKKERQLAHGAGRVHLQMKNYRSEPELLLFLNDLFTRMSDQFQAMEPREEPQPNSRPTIATFISADEGDGLGTAKNLNEDLAVANTVIDLLEKGESPSEICVLARNNKDISFMAQFLKDRGVPTQLHSASGFLDRREIQDALSLLRFLVNPSDNANLIQLLRSPFCRVLDDDLARLGLERPNYYWPVLANNLKDKYASVRWLIGALDHLGRQGVSAVFENGLTELGLIDLSHWHDATGKREANLWKLLSDLRESERQPGFSYLEFIAAEQKQLDDLEALQEGEAVAASEPNRVNLMTVHASKGLQFNHVILMRAHKDPLRKGGRRLLFQGERETNKWAIGIPLESQGKVKFPIVSEALFSRQIELELQEFERVLYVALTRAKKSVTVTWVDRWQKGCWASLLPFDTSGGEILGENYRVELKSGTFEERQFVSTTEANGGVRPRYSFEMDALKQARVSVSQILEEGMGLEQLSTGIKASGTDLFSALSRPSRGVLIHEVLEVSCSQPLEVVEDLVKRKFGNEAPDIVKAVNWVHRLKNPPMEEIFSNGEVEWGFQLKTQRGILEGQVDLWGLDDRGTLWIVDYKSGSETFKEKAFRQLNIYSLALRKLYPTTDVRLAVLYPVSESMDVRAAASVEQISKEYRL